MRFSVFSNVLKAAQTAVYTSPSAPPSLPSRPFLILFSMVDAMHKVLKDPIAERPAGDHWENAMLSNITEHQADLIQRIHSDVLEPYSEEWTQFENLTEFLDSLGWIVLSFLDFNISV